MRYHFIAIGGAVMHNLALALHQMGHQVSGSDDQIFEPSRTRLAKAGILPEKLGWNPEVITPEIDAVILGMHARIDNPEMIKAQEIGVKIYSFPEFIAHHTQDKIRVVVAGSHGKTTITSMLMHVLKSAGKEFDYLVGSQIEGFQTMVQISDAPIVILEGDEYLTSPLDSRPKFLWYHPHIALISGIAWDHMNVFPTWESYVDAFRSFAKTMPVNGYLVFDQEDQALFSLMNEDSLPGTRVGYGPHQHEVTQERCSLITKNGKIPIEVFGKHNLKNIEGARLICHQLGISDETFYQGIQSFKGAAKRMEAWKNTKSEVVFRDFAHSPSKLKATVDAVRLQYPERYVTAVFELFTYSSLNSAFLPQYQGSMDAADEAWIYYNPDQLSMKKLPYFEPSLVEESFNHPKLKVFTQAEQLWEALEHRKNQNSALMLMSSGNFNNLPLEQLKENK
jgi:UDP-N-acetylmuramate: L-alanyl-gamma-D-glutamyl-meso-diaminopimelate ligase